MVIFRLLNIPAAPFFRIFTLTMKPRKQVLPELCFSHNVPTMKILTAPRNHHLLILCIVRFVEGKTNFALKFYT